MNPSDCVFRYGAVLGLLAALTSSNLYAEGNDEIAGKLIREATTSDEFITDWVKTLPEDDKVPSPRDVLGYTIGTPGKLTSVDKIDGYFRALAKASSRVKVFSLGKSFEGREMIVAAIANKRTIARIDDYRQMTRQLADPRKTNREQADDIINVAKPIYWITAGLHSPELGPPEMVMELAYRLAVEDDDVFNKIRHEVIVLITPVLETDGRARQVEWYRQSVAQYPDYDNSPPKSPPFWGHYIFHDNNRDGLVFSQPLTRNYVNAFYHWMPTLSLDLHESVPLLYVSTGTGPYNTAVDPITVTEWQSVANYEVSRLTAKGVRGVWTWGFYTGWFPGYLLWVTNNHNSNGRFYETFGNHSALTMNRDLRGRKMAGKKVTDVTWYRAKPPKQKFVWSMRNNTNLMQSAAIASLEMVSKNPVMFLENFYQKSVNSMTRAIKTAPYAFVISQQQSDNNAAHDLLAILHQHAVEVSQVQDSFSWGEDNSIKPGDYVVMLNQPYGGLAQNLLEKQKFPDKVEVPPYDDVAWTLGLQMGVEITPVDDIKILQQKVQPANIAAAFTEPVGEDSQRYFIIDHRAQNELGPLRFELLSTPFFAAEQPFTLGETQFHAGSFIIDSKDSGVDVVRKAIARHGLIAVNQSTLPDVKTHELDPPRIALLHSWVSTQNTGWLRFTLDDSGVPYTLLDKDRLAKGHLQEDFDVIVAPSYIGADLADLIGGIDPKWSPLPYRKSPSTPSFGVIASADDITGGFGFVGMESLSQFIHNGGTFIGLLAGGVVATSSGITHEIHTKHPAGLNSPGSILTTKIMASSPLTWGYPQWSHVFRGNGPLYQVADQHRDMVLMQFGSKQVPALTAEEKEQHKSDKKSAEKTPALALSGAILHGKDVIDGAAALLYEQVGKGSVVIFAWNPMHRHINHHDHAFFYNAVLNWNDLAGTNANAAIQSH